MNKDSWFERALFCFGYSTGVFAIGFVLLRIVDPENKSKTVEDVAMTPFLNFIEIAFWSLIPVSYTHLDVYKRQVLFITMGIAKAKMKEALTYLAPYLGIICIVILLLIFVPQISLLLPRLLF